MIETCELYPGADVYKPMLVLKTPDNASELMKSGDYIAQQKKDGYFYQLVKTAGGDVYLFSRSKSKKTGFYSEKIANVPHIKEWAEQIPNDTILLGEVYYPGKTSKNVTSIMGCLSEKAVTRQNGEYGLIHYYVHDMIRYAGKDYVKNKLDFERRYSNLCGEIDLKLDNPEYIEIATSLTGYGMEDTIGSWMDRGEEGAVLKLKSGLYLPGKRRKEMWKIKQHEDSLDFVITGFVEPEKEYTGKEIETWKYWATNYKNKEELKNIRQFVSDQDFDSLLIKYNCNFANNDDWSVGIPITKGYFYGWKMGFTIGLYDGDHIQEIGKVTSGLDDSMREDIAKNPDKYLGQVVEISCMSVDKDKMSVRHPVFVRMRDDKNPKDCRLELIF